MKKNVKDESNMEIDPYSVDKLSKVPSWLIVLLLKYWAAAAAVFFIVIGGLDIGLDFTQGDNTDVAAVLSTSFVIIMLIGLFMALFSNYIVRPLVRLMHNRRNNTFRYNMINMKGFKSFLLSFAYMLGMSFALFFITAILSYHGLVLDLFGRSDGQGIEPFTYAFCFIILDTICLLIKYLVLYIYERVKYNKQIKGE